MAALASEARPDVDVQREYDARRGMSLRLLAHRFTAAVDAARAVEDLEPMAAFALRQALVDLSSCAEELAATLPAPQAHMSDRPKRPRRR